MREVAPGIAVDDAVRFGRPVLAGTRVPVELVLGKLAAGMTTDDLVAEYGVIAEGVRAALACAAKVLKT